MFAEDLSDEEGDEVDEDEMLRSATCDDYKEDESDEDNVITPI